MAEFEVGKVTAHPIVFMWIQVKTIFKTWRYCKRRGLQCREWWGVYEKGTEIIIAQTGCLPCSELRAKKILDNII